MLGTGTGTTGRRRAFARVGAAALLAVGAGACGDDGESDPEAAQELDRDATIVYRFGDSSVPPEFHRSYTLTISADAVDVVVDSYGDVLHESTVDLPPDVWDALTSESAVVHQVAETASLGGAEEGCAGGTSREISVTDGDGETVVTTSFGVCGGANEDVADQLDGYVQPVIDAIPDWDAMLE